MREAAGLTLDTAAPKLYRKRSALHRVETGETRADVHLIKSMMDLYDHFDPNILDEAKRAFEAPWYQAYGVKDLGYVDVETEASELNQFLALNIPGLLQTEAYMRALFSSVYTRSMKQLDNDVAVRIIRQQRLTDMNRPLGLVTIVHEAALRRMVGGQEVMLGQLQHLLELSKLPTVTLQVVPLDGGTNWVPIGPFTLLRFPDPIDAEMLFVEYPTGALQIQKPAQVQEARLLFERLRAETMGVADSVGLIKRLASELQGS